MISIRENMPYAHLTPDGGLNSSGGWVTMLEGEEITLAELAGRYARAAREADAATRRLDLLKDLLKENLS